MESEHQEQSCLELIAELKLLIKHGEANSYCFTVSCVPEGMLNYLE